MSSTECDSSLKLCITLFFLTLEHDQRWLDEYLVWDKEKYGNVETIRIPANQIWTPDLVITNLYVFNFFTSPIV